MLKPKTAKEEESKFESAMGYKTPHKRQVRESLEDDDLKGYASMGVEDTMDWELAKEYFNKINKALQVNQKEHEKIRNCQVELEDNFREILFASEFKTGLLTRKIGKRPKTMDSKFDGPDLYGVIGLVASELVDVEDEVNDKVGKLELVTELKDHHSKVLNDMIKDFSTLKKDLKKDFQSELCNVKKYYEAQIKQVRSGWVGAFGNVKTAFKEVFLDLKDSIDQLEVDNRIALTIAPDFSCCVLLRCV